MSQPTAYSPAHEFLTDEVANPNFPGSELDIELNALNTTLDEILTNLALIQRDDGALKNGIVTTDSLDTTLAAALGDVAAIAEVEALIAQADADVVLTHADVVLTHADVVLTHADVVLTHADVVSAAASAAAAAASAASVSYTLDTDGTLAANSDSRVPSQKAVKTYADALIAANDAMVFKGVIDCSANPNYPAADRGHTYKVSVAGKIGGASGTTVEAGDMAICITDATSAGDQATVGTNWAVVQTNLVGAYVAGGTDVALADGGTGASLVDPNADRILFWDDSAGTMTWLTPNPGLSISGTTLIHEEVHGIALSDETTAITTGTNKATFSLPYAFTVTGVYATLNTVSSSGTPTVDINEAGTTILSTKLTIDANEKTSGPAATPAVISDASIAANAEIGFDIDVAGTGAKGLKVFIQGYRT